MTTFLKALYEEKLQMAEEQLHQAAELSGHDLRSSQFRVLIVSCRKQVEDLEGFCSYCMDMPRLCKRFFEKNHIRAEVESDCAGKCMILLMASVEKRAVERVASSLLSYLESKRFLDAVIAVGKYVSSITDVPYSYRTALNALNYESLFSGVKCLFVEDMQMTMTVTSLYSIIDPNRVLAAFQDGDMQRLRNLVTVYAERVRAMSGESIEGCHPTSIRRMFIELTVYALHIASDMGVDVGKTLNGLDPYNFLMAGDKSTPIIIDWFISMCGDLRSAIDEKAKAKERNVAQRVCSYIDEHIAQYDLSLEDAAVAVNMTPSYLSRLFHKDVGIGFAKYVVQRRVEVAKNLLRTTALPIKEVAAQVGFSSANYFGTVFKKEMQISPQAYRAATQEKVE